LLSFELNIRDTGSLRIVNSLTRLSITRISRLELEKEKYLRDMGKLQ